MVSISTPSYWVCFCSVWAGRRLWKCIICTANVDHPGVTRQKSTRRQHLGYLFLKWHDADVTFMFDWVLQLISVPWNHVIRPVKDQFWMTAVCGCWWQGCCVVADGRVAACGCWWQGHCVWLLIAGLLCAVANGRVIVCVVADSRVVVCGCWWQGCCVLTVVVSWDRHQPAGTDGPHQEARHEERCRDCAGHL